MVDRNGQTAEFIILAGVIVIVLGMIAAGWLFFQDIGSVQKKMQKIEGDGEKISANVAQLADSCWEKSGKGTSSRHIDCFKVEVRNSEQVDPEDVKQELQVMQKDKLDMEPLVRDVGDVKISYVPERNRIEVQPF